MNQIISVTTSVATSTSSVRRATPAAKSSIRIACFVMGLALVQLLAGSAFAQDPAATYAEFSAPGAGTGGGQGTVPISINTSGQITGYYYDSVVVGHGFERSAS